MDVPLDDSFFEDLKQSQGAIGFLNTEEQVQRSLAVDQEREDQLALPTGTSMNMEVVSSGDLTKGDALQSSSESDVVYEGLNEKDELSLTTKSWEIAEMFTNGLKDNDMRGEPRAKVLPVQGIDMKDIKLRYTGDKVIETSKTEEQSSSLKPDEPGFQVMSKDVNVEVMIPKDEVVGVQPSACEPRMQMSSENAANIENVEPNIPEDEVAENSKIDDESLSMKPNASSEPGTQVLPKDEVDVKDVELSKPENEVTENSEMDEEPSTSEPGTQKSSEDGNVTETTDLKQPEDKVSKTPKMGLRSSSRKRKSTRPKKFKLCLTGGVGELEVDLDKIDENPPSESESYEVVENHSADEEWDPEEYSSLNKGEKVSPSKSKAPRRRSRRTRAKKKTAPKVTSKQNKHLKIKLEGLEKPTYNCEMCSFGAPRKIELLKHKRAEHPKEKKVHLCDLCGKECKTKYSLEAHLRVHNNERPFICDICGNGFVSSVNLGTHKRELHSGLRFACEECDRVFPNKSYLRRHIERKHRDERNFECDVCFKRFKEKKHLKCHTRMHTGEKPFFCKEPGCEKRFKQQCGLHAHRRTHTGELTFICKVCNKAFMYNSSLKGGLCKGCRPLHVPADSAAFKEHMKKTEVNSSPQIVATVT